jgi:hypothetical protein
MNADLAVVGLSLRFAEAGLIYPQVRINTKTLMPDTLTSAQQALAEYMSQLSEQAYAAGWIEGLEYALWKAVVAGPYKYGRQMLTGDHVRELRKLSEACGGWIRFSDVGDESFVSLDQWQHTFTLRGTV